MRQSSERKAAAQGWLEALGFQQELHWEPCYGPAGKEGSKIFREDAHLGHKEGALVRVATCIMPLKTQVRLGGGEQQEKKETPIWATKQRNRKERE